MIIEICNFVSQRSNTDDVFFIGGFLMADYEGMCNGFHPCLNKTKIYAASIDNRDIMVETAEHKPVKCPMHENGGVLAFAKMATEAKAEMIMIDFSRVSSIVPEDVFKSINDSLRVIFTNAGYVDTYSYDMRWSFARIPDGCKYDKVNNVFVKE